MYGHEQRTFKIFCRADEGYCITVRNDDAIVLAPTDAGDEYQHWYKDMRRSTSVKDEAGCPAFALVNKATGLAMKHSLGQSHPVKLVPYEYDPENLDESVMWTESHDVGDGFRCIRMVNNIHLNLDAFLGDEGGRGVHDGTQIVLWEWNKGDNQSWKILSWGQQAPERDDLALSSSVHIFCAASEEYSVTVRDRTVCLAPTDDSDECQHWVKDMRHSTSIKDEEGNPAFALVNKATGEAIKHSHAQSDPVGLVRYDPEHLDESVLWTESHDVGDGFRCIRKVNNIHLNFDAFLGDDDGTGVHDGTRIVLWEWNKGGNQSWKILPW